MSDSRRLDRSRRSGLTRLGFWVALAMTILPAAPLSAHDIWPLVKLADGAVWGSLVEVRDGYEDRLLVIAVRQEGGGGDAGGPSTVQLLSRSGRFPESLQLEPGDCGLFLRCPTRGESEFSLADGSFVAHGFLPLDPSARERWDLDAMMATSWSSASWDSGEARSQALSLLRSADEGCRRAAIGWLVECGRDLGEPHRDLVAEAFQQEDDARNQEAFLRLFVLHDWTLAGGGASRLLVTRDDEGVADAATWYLSKYAGPSDKATLLEAFPEAPQHRWPTLLEVYGRLGLEEATPWWQAALLSGDRNVVVAAVEKLAISGLPAVEETYEVLLESSEPALRGLALRGLGTVASPRAIATLRNFAEGEPPESPLRKLAADILAHPFRYGRVPARSLQTSEERP